MKKLTISLLLFVIAIFQIGCSLTNIVSASKNRNFEQVKAHVEKGNDINLIMFDWTALQYGAFYGNSKIVKYLIENGADLNIQRENGFAALHYATYYENLRIAKYLIEGKADLDIQDIRGFTALHYAAYYGNLEIVKVLVENGAKKDIQDEQGYTPLYYAKLHASIEIQKLLQNVN